jgi:polyamine oxidase
MSLILLPLLLSTLVLPILGLPIHPSSAQTPLDTPKDARVLILGGGVAGVTAAHALYDHGVEDFIILEARHELGGRMLSHTFGSPGKQYTVELGANWVQGTRTGDGPENPIWTLAKKHQLRTQMSSYFDGLSEYLSIGVTNMTVSQHLLAMYDESGQVDYTDKVKASAKNFDRLIASAGKYKHSRRLYFVCNLSRFPGSRIPKGLVDASARTGYSLTGSYPHSAHEMAAEYYQVTLKLMLLISSTAYGV